MKRLNPKTNKPFERGDVREDGHVFWGYKKHIKRNGLFSETWTHPEKIPKTRAAKNHKTPTGRAYNLLSSAKDRAERKNLEFNLSVDKIIATIKKGHCELTGLKFNMNKTTNTHINPYSPSIDRKDSSKGYTDDNVRVVLSAVNSALGQYDDKTILPILKAMVKAIEKNAQQNTAAPVSEGTYIQGAVGAELGSISTPWTWEDYDHTDNHSGAVHWQDADHSAQAGSGDSVGCGSKEVATLVTSYDIQNHGEPGAEIVRLEFGRRYLLDKP